MILIQSVIEIFYKTILKKVYFLFYFILFIVFKIIALQPFSLLYLETQKQPRKIRRKKLTLQQLHKCLICVIYLNVFLLLHNHQLLSLQLLCTNE
jgi:sterol desaturase/sphingolipid hydroxylase (fatty acid hydroxylase superfamily)